MDAGIPTLEFWLPDIFLSRLTFFCPAVPYCSERVGHDRGSYVNPSNICLVNPNVGVEAVDRQPVSHFLDRNGARQLSRCTELEPRCQPVVVGPLGPSV